MNKYLVIVTSLCTSLSFAEVFNAPATLRAYNLKISRKLEDINKNTGALRGQSIAIPTEKFPGTVQNPKLLIQAQKVTVEGKEVKIYDAYAEFSADFWKFQGGAGKFAAVQIDCNNFIARMLFNNPLVIELPTEIDALVVAKSGKLSASINFNIEEWSKRVIGPYFEMAHLEKNLGIDASRCSGSEGRNKHAILGIIAAQLRSALNKLPENDSAGFNREVKTLIPHLNKAIETTLAKENVKLPQTLDLSLNAQIKFEDGEWVLRASKDGDIESQLSPLAQAQLSKFRSRANINEELAFEAVVGTSALSQALRYTVAALQKTYPKLTNADDLKNIDNQVSPIFSLFKGDVYQPLNFNDIPEVNSLITPNNISFEGIDCEEASNLSSAKAWTLATKDGKFKQGLDLRAPIRLNLGYAKNSKEFVGRWAYLNVSVEMLNVNKSVQFKVQSISLSGPDKTLCGVFAMSEDDTALINKRSYSDEYLTHMNNELQKSFTSNGQAEVSINVLLSGEVPQNDTNKSAVEAIAASLSDKLNRSIYPKSLAPEKVEFNTYGDAIMILVRNPIINSRKSADAQ